PRPHPVRPFTLTSEGSSREDVEGTSTGRTSPPAYPPHPRPRDAQHRPSEGSLRRHPKRVLSREAAGRRLGPPRTPLTGEAPPGPRSTVLVTKGPGGSGGETQGAFAFSTVVTGSSQDGRGRLPPSPVQVLGPTCLPPSGRGMGDVVGTCPVAGEDPGTESPPVTGMAPGLPSARSEARP
uniref:Uncharacterized protein n=1 Tax=Mustela putorius furo TaxID=9669 RepID=M3YCZ4_MUSPF